LWWLREGLGGRCGEGGTGHGREEVLLNIGWFNLVSISRGLDVQLKKKKLDHENKTKVQTFSP
jgi:hypothetical protein